MEWSWRTVLILLGLLGIAVILVDGFRRMKRARADALRLDIKPSSDIQEDNFNPELPGSVRVVGVFDSDETDVFADTDAYTPVSKPSLIERTSEYEAAQNAQALEKKAVEKKGYEKKVKHSTAAETKTYSVTVKRKEPTLGVDSNINSNVASRTTRDQENAQTEELVADDTPLEASRKSTAEFETSDVPQGMFSDYAPDRTCTDKTTAKESRIDSISVDDDIPNSPLIPTVKPVDLNEQVPVLLDVEELGDEASFEEGIVSQPRVVSTSFAVDKASDASAESEGVSAKSGDNTTTIDVDITAGDITAGDIPQNFVNSGVSQYSDAQSSDLPEVENPDTLNDPHLEDEVEQIPDESLISQPVNYAGPNAEVLASRRDAEMVLVIHTIARDMDGFRGKDLLFLFNSCDLRYGEKDIFHRFEDADGEGCIQFSVAQMHNPGTFDPAQMADQSFSGLSFFMSLPGPKKPLEAYEAMSEMARVVSRNLKADVLDGSHSAMTPQTMEHERQQILDYERQQRLAAKKQRL